jgi:hypothetical protein
VFERRKLDEVVVFTLPKGISRWLHLDLPHQVERNRRRRDGRAFGHLLHGPDRRASRAGLAYARPITIQSASFGPIPETARQTKIDARRRGGRRRADPAAGCSATAA